MYKKLILLVVATLFIYNTYANATQFRSSNVEKRYFKKTSVKATGDVEQSVRFGFSHITGNVETLNLNAKYAMSVIVDGYGNQPLKFALLSSAYFSKGNDKKSNEEYFVDLGMEQVIYDGWLGYMATNWFRNPHFRNYNHKISFNTGIGKELLTDNINSFKLKLGVAYNIEDYSSNKETERYGSINGYIEYKNKLNENSNFNIKLGSMKNFSNTDKDYEALAVIGIDFSVTKNINIMVEEELHYDALPTGGLEKFDSKSMMTIGYHF